MRFDGANIWVANYGDDTVTKLRANDGQVLRAFAVGTKPANAAFDGANIWTTNEPVSESVSQFYELL